MTLQEEIQLLDEEAIRWRTEAMVLHGKAAFAERQEALCRRRAQQITGAPITAVAGLHDHWRNGALDPIARQAPIQHEPEGAA